MRRFIAYILACITIFLGVGVAFKPVATRIKGDLSYRNGQEISFRIYDHNSESTPIEEEHVVKDYAATMESRLKAFGTTDYTIATHGLNTITVTLTGRDKTEYERIANLLSTNPIIEISTTNDDDKDKIYRLDDTDKLWHSSSAYLEYSGNTTIVVMPIPSQYKTRMTELITAAKKIEEGSKASNDEPKKVTNSIVLWMNRKDNEFYKNKASDKNVASKIIYDEFNSTNFFQDTNENAFKISFAPTSANGTDIRAAYDKAVYYMNLLNAKETDYDCRTIYSKEIPASVENLLYFGDRVSVAWSWTLISLILGFVIIGGFLVFFYRISAVAILATSLGTAFTTLFIFTLFNPLFNVATIVGLCALFLASVVTGIAHNNFLHEEVYKGRSLKKANFEASKKTTLITVDISVISLISGVLLYFIGGNTVSSIGVIFIIGAVLNLFINTFLFKGLMWLITNNTSFQKKYKVFAINSKQVPDLSKEEKPTYEAPFKKTNFSKKIKPASIIFGALTFASIIGMIIFGSINKTMFNSSKYYKSSNEVFISIRQDTELFTEDDLTSRVLKNIKNNNNSLNYNTELLTYNYEITVTTTSTPKVEKYYEYVVTVNESNMDSETYRYETTGYTGDNKSLQEAVIEGITKCGVTATTLTVDTRVKAPYTIASNSGLIVAGVITSLAVSVIYLWIRRYKASRITSLFVVSASSVAISLGILTLCRIPATPVMAIGAAMTGLISLLLGIFIIAKDKDLYRDERMKDVATRKKVMNEAIILGLSPAFVFGLLAIFANIGYFALTAKFYSAVFLSSSIGLIFALLMYMIIFAPLTNFLDDKFSRVKLPEIKIRKKKKEKKKSNEPEEAVFIGIND